MGFFENIGRRTAKKETYEAMSAETRYGLDRELPGVRANREKEIKEAAYNFAISQFQIKITHTLLRSLKQENPDGDADALKKEIDARVTAFRKSPNKNSFDTLNDWVLSKTHTDLVKPVGEILGHLYEDLTLQGLKLGE